MRTRVSLWLFAALTASMAPAAITGSNGYTAHLAVPDPNPGDTLGMGPFDFDGDGNVYTMQPSTVWGAEFYLSRFDGVSHQVLHSENALFGGSTVRVIGSHVYFTDGGSYSVSDASYHTIALSGGAHVNRGVQNNLFSPTMQEGSLFGAGGSYGAQTIVMTTVNGDGSFNAVTPISDTIAAAGGPVAFDAAGDLFFANGYGNEIWRWTAAEVATATGGGSPLVGNRTPWATFVTPGGATSMTFDNDGNLLLTATGFVGSSEVQRLFIDGTGAYAGVEVLATSDGRLHDVRVHNGDIYASDSSGIYQVVPEPASLIALLLGAAVLRLRTRDRASLR